MTGTELANDTAHNLSPEGLPLLARYDLDRIKQDVDMDALVARNAVCLPGFWKWRELLPVKRDEDVVALGEVDTPLMGAPNTASHRTSDCKR